MSSNHTEESEWKLIGESILRSYGIVYFSQSQWFGAVVLLCTLIAYPIQGLIGLIGLSITLIAAVQLKLDRQLVKSGIYQFNTLLISLTLGYYFRQGFIDTKSLLILLPCASLFTLLVTVSLSDIMYRSLGIPAISLPFVISQTLLIFVVAPHATPVSPVEAVPAPLPQWELGAATLTQHLKTILNTMSAILLMPNYYVGAIILGAMFILSRLYVFFAILGFAVSMTVLSLLPVSLSSEQASMLAFNFAFCSIAIGGVFFIPSRRSLVLAIFSTAICTLISVVVVKVFSSSRFMPIALPVNFVVLLMLHAMKMRFHSGNLNLTPFMPTTPEENYRKFSLVRERFPDSGYPTIRCPFSGERVITQGFEGKVTHQEDWKYALDFEILDRSGKPGLEATDELDDYFTFGTPVLAAANGTVVKVINDIEDGKPGTQNLIDNWGNLVILAMDNGYYLMVCHLQKDSIKCYEGKRVRQGETLALCGNSGRSPAPHLHVQLQSTPTVGAGTVQFYLTHFYIKDGQKLTYHASGIPTERTKIRAAMVNSRVAECFTNLKARNYRFQISHKGKTTEETISCTIDPLGNILFESENGDHFKASLKNHVFQIFDSEVNQGVLHWMMFGLSTVPFIDNDSAVWHDIVDSRKLISPSIRWLIDSLAPFWNYPKLTTTGQISRCVAHEYSDRSQIKVETDISAASSPFISTRKFPRKVTTFLSQTDWITALVVDLEEPMIIEQINESNPIEVAHLSAQKSPRFITKETEKTLVPSSRNLMQ